MIFYLSKFYFFTLIILYVKDPHFSSFFRKRKKKKRMNASHSAKRRKKDRGQAPACREIGEYAVFFLRKKFRQRRKGIFGVTHTYVRTNVTVSPEMHRTRFAFSGCYCVNGRKCTLLLKRGARTFFEEKLSNYSLTLMPLRCQCQRSSFANIPKVCIFSFQEKYVTSSP